MKTKTFLLVCLFMDIGLIRLSAQNGNGTIHYGTNVYYDVYVPVYCGTDVIDEIYYAELTVTSKDHIYSETADKWMNRINNQSGVSVKTGEVFKVQGFDHWDGKQGYVTSTGHLIGDKGNNYYMSVTFDINTWEIIKVHSVCY
jgi:hypothetical protein